MHGAKINWIPSRQESYRFTGQTLTYEDIRRLQHKIEACMEVIESLSVDRSTYSKHQKVRQSPLVVSRNP